MTDQDTILKPTLSEWRYVPEFARDDKGNVTRVGSPGFAHTSGAVVDLTVTKNLRADMLDAEGRIEEASVCRRITNDPQAFARWVSGARS